MTDPLEARAPDLLPLTGAAFLILASPSRLAPFAIALFMGYAIIRLNRRIR